MKKMHFVLATIVLAMLAQPALAQDMSFFLTSMGSGNGADLGGLAGADRHCQALAEAVGSSGKTWRAYLSTTASTSMLAVNARDRIGSGPLVQRQGGSHRFGRGGPALRQQ